MHILILGINHQIQQRQLFGWSSNGKVQEFEQDQKEHFGQMLHEQIQKHRIEFVGEETNRAQESIAQEVCRKQNCRYANIEMTTEERARCKILPGYNENPTVSESEKIRGNREREAYMGDQILTEGHECNCVLVICGDMHSDALAARFRDAGHSTEIDDLRNYGWYIEDWMGHMMNL